MTEEELTFECVVDADLFRRAHLGVSKELTRYYLNGVHVSPCPEGGALIVATDGSMMIVMRDPDAVVTGAGIVSLERPMIQTLAAKGDMVEKRLVCVRSYKGGRGRAFIIDQASNKPTDNDYSPYTEALTVFADPDRRVRAAQFHAVVIDGTFPDWRHILPPQLDHDATWPSFDMDKLATIRAAICDRGTSDFQIASSGPNSPSLITTRSMTGREGFAILMPLRTERRKDAVPTWALAPVVQAA